MELWQDGGVGEMGLLGGGDGDGGSWRDPGL